jgi:hypothetical protein
MKISMVEKELIKWGCDLVEDDGKLLIIEYKVYDKNIKDMEEGEYIVNIMNSLIGRRLQDVKDRKIDLKDFTDVGKYKYDKM